MRSDAANENRIIWVLAAVQFINILDFMMVMPLGPDFAISLHIPLNQLGLIAGSYTASAAIAGVISSFFLDRFERRTALMVTMIGIAIGTFAGGLATGMGTLILARVIAGAFGGPATAISFAIIADIIPPERRGKAMGLVLSSFAIASILGVPIGLELARFGTYRLTFFSVGVLGLIMCVAVRILLPAIKVHPSNKPSASQSEIRGDFVNAVSVWAWVGTGLQVIGAFLVIPNISSFIQQNLEYPREHLARLYLAGGAMSLLANRLAGSAVDKLGSFWVGTIGCGVLSLVLYFGFAQPVPTLPVILIFMGFMFSGGVRNVSFSALSSRVPAPHQRARFMSIQSAVRHAATSSGALISSRLLSEDAQHRLIGMPRVALAAIVFTVLVIPLQYYIEKRVQERENIAKNAEPALAASSE
jgi:predicted MFS family arabinose efflux permease